MADLRAYVYSVDVDTGATFLFAQAVTIRLSGNPPIEAQGQQLMAASIPVVMASNQSAIAVDTELPAAVVLADGMANPTPPAVGSFNMVWNTATWDRMPGATATGVLVNTELPAAAALADNAGNPTTPMIGACLLGYDGGTWDRIYTIADGDAVAAGTKGFIVLGTDGANYQVIKVDALGAVAVVVGLPVGPVTEYETAAAVAAGAVGVLTTSEQASHRLSGVEVWASVGCKVTLHTVDNGVESAILVIGGFAAFGGFYYKPPHPNYIVLGATAGLDAFRVNVTNLDDANAADVYATFHYEDV